jgi:tRNA(Ile)-lysidine synthase
VEFGEGGEFALRRDALGAAHPREAGRRLAALCLCAAGGARPPRREALGRLLRKLAAPGPFTAVLAGARLEARGDRLLVSREAGEFGRTGLGEAALPVGESVFDGRFLITAPAPGWSVRPLRGLAKQLPAAERARLGGVPAAARGGLPVVAGPGGALSCPVLAQAGPVGSIPLARERFLAAIGSIQNEASIERVAKPRRGA